MWLKCAVIAKHDCREQSHARLLVDTSIHFCWLYTYKRKRQPERGVYSDRVDIPPGFSKCLHQFIFLIAAHSISSCSTFSPALGIVSFCNFRVMVSPCSFNSRAPDF